MSTTTNTPTVAASRSDRVHDELERALLEGMIDPDARLTEPKVSVFFGVSRTPVREALSRLCSSGLVKRCEFGYAPIRPTVVGVRDLYELRSAIELAGIRRAMDNADVCHDMDILARERDRWLGFHADIPDQYPGFVLEDEKFHLAVLSAAGNPELVAGLRSVNARIRRVRMHDFMVNMRIETTITEHLAILDAIGDGSLGHAEELLRNHIGASLDVVIERVQKAIAAIESTDYSLTEIGRALR